MSCLLIYVLSIYRILYIVIATRGINWRTRDKHYSKSGFLWFPLQHHIIVNLESCNSQWNDIENPDTKCDVNFIMVIFWVINFSITEVQRDASNQDDLAVLHGWSNHTWFKHPKTLWFSVILRIFEAIIKIRNAEFRLRHEIHLHY